eukprot:Hpha_TRINITY_DN15284_c7_g5::TRINITY_DN15284_c7_g5_i1::g.67101::m.67101
MGAGAQATSATADAKKCSSGKDECACGPSEGSPGEPRESCCPADSEPPAPRPEGYVEAGKEIELASGLRCYVVGKPGGKTLLIAYDVFGFHGGRTRLICDRLAGEGYYVIMPDVFQGVHVAPDTDSQVWLALNTPKMVYRLWKYCTWPQVGPRFEETLAHVRAAGATQVGCLGFCYGGWVVTHLAGLPGIAAVVGCHPSLQLCGIFREDREALLRAVRCPLMYLAAANDKADVKPGGQAEAIVTREGGPGGAFKEYPTMKHGWVARGTYPETEEALQRVTSYFAEHMPSRL